MSKLYRQHKLYTIWNKVPVNYYQDGVRKNLPQKIWHHLKIKSAKKVLRQHHFNNCLDIGCASGFMLSQIASEYPNAKYIGVDIFGKAIKHAKKLYPNINFTVAAADKLPFKNNSFDVILFYETIEHVENPKAALQEIQRVLKKDGLLVLSMDSGNWLFRIIWLIWEHTTGKVWQGAHLHPFHHSELGKIIEKSSLKIRKKFFTHFGMEVTFLATK